MELQEPHGWQRTMNPLAWFISGMTFRVPIRFFGKEVHIKLAEHDYKNLKIGTLSDKTANSMHLFAQILKVKV